MKKCKMCNSPAYSLDLCQKHYRQEYDIIKHRRFLISTLNRLGYSDKTREALLIGGDLLDERLSEI